MKNFIILLLIIFIFNPEAFARKKRTKKKKVTKQSKTLRYVDNTQQFISDNWIEFNYFLDTFFSNKKYNKKKNKSMIMAYCGIYQNKDSSLEVTYDLKLKIHLPKVTEKMSLIIEKERDEIFDATSSTTKNQTNSLNSNQSNNNYTAGVRYGLLNSSIWKGTFDTGLRIILPLNPYSKLKFSRAFETRFLNIYMGQSFILYRQEGFKEMTQFSIYKGLSDRVKFSQNNVLSWTDSSDTFNLRNDLNISHLISSRKTISYIWGANAKLSPVFHYTSYDFSLNLRQLLYQRWLFGSLSIGAEFPKDKNFDPIPYVFLKLEVYFK